MESNRAISNGTIFWIAEIHRKQTNSTSAIFSPQTLVL